VPRAGRHSGGSPAAPRRGGIDVASGALLALSPWLFGFADRVFCPHLIVGL
jgi:hypothetical protein